MAPCCDVRAVLSGGPPKLSPYRGEPRKSRAEIVSVPRSQRHDSGLSVVGAPYVSSKFRTHTERIGRVAKIILVRIQLAAEIAAVV